MGKKVEIIKVMQDNEKVTVWYVTGTERIYPVDKLPKTVKAWFDARSEEPEAMKEMIQEEPKQEERKEEMKEVATIIPVETEENPIAAGLVEFGYTMLLSLALGTIAIIGVVSVMIEAIKTLFCIAKSHKSDIKNAILTVEKPLLKSQIRLSET